MNSEDIDAVYALREAYSKEMDIASTDHAYATAYAAYAAISEVMELLGLYGRFR